MSNVVVQGACLECQFGQAPSTLTVTSTMGKSVTGQKIATIMDFAPMVNISPFGQCSSPMNPAYIAATAVGSPPPPCMPAIVAPWTPGSSNSKITEIPVLVVSDKTSCAFAPEGISITNNGQQKAQTK